MTGDAQSQATASVDIKNFEDLLTFIKTNYQGTIAQNNNPLRPLRAQLTKLIQAKKQGNDYAAAVAANPDNPAIIDQDKTNKNLVNLLHAMPAENWRAFFQVLGVSISKELIPNSDSLAVIVNGLNKDEYKPFVSALENSFLNYLFTISSAEATSADMKRQNSIRAGFPRPNTTPENKLYECVKGIETEKRLAFLQALGRQRVTAFFTDGDVFTNFVSLLPSTQRWEFIDFIDKQYINECIGNNYHQSIRLMALLPERTDQEKYKYDLPDELYRNVTSNLFSIVENHEHQLIAAIVKGFVPVNSVDQKERPLLHIAVHQDGKRIEETTKYVNKKELIFSLVLLGANLSAKDKQKKTAHELFAELEKEPITKRQQKSGAQKLIIKPLGVGKTIGPDAKKIIKDAEKKLFDLYQTKTNDIALYKNFDSALEEAENAIAVLSAKHPAEKYKDDIRKVRKYIVSLFNYFAILRRGEEKASKDTDDPYHVWRAYQITLSDKLEVLRQAKAKDTKAGRLVAGAAGKVAEASSIFVSPAYDPKQLQQIVPSSHGRGIPGSSRQQPPRDPRAQLPMAPTSPRAGGRGSP